LRDQTCNMSLDIIYKKMLKMACTFLVTVITPISLNVT